MTENVSPLDPQTFDVDGDPQDEVFEVLSHPHRRFTLRYLVDAETPLPVEDLTVGIVGWEVDQPLSERTTSDREAIEASLVHNHLPRMAEAGLVDHDRTMQTVELVDGTSRLHEHLEAMQTD